MKPHTLQAYRTLADADWETKIEPHYRASPLILPPEPDRRTWFIRSARTGARVRLTCETTLITADRLLDLHPLHVAYSSEAHDVPGTYLDLPLYLPTKARTTRALEILRDDFGLGPESLDVSTDGRGQFQILVRAPWAKARRRADIERLLRAFHPEGFQPPAGKPHTPSERRYHAARVGLLAAWAKMNPAQLESHLRAKTPLGGHLDAVLEIIRQPDRLDARLERAPRIAAYLHEAALDEVFPRPNIDKALAGGRTVPAGTYVWTTGAVARQIPLRSTRT